MNNKIIFCHGWGLDHNFWQNISNYFTNSTNIYLKLGYFNDFNHHKLNKTSQYIGIGHSQGLSKLISLDLNYSALIGINSFTNFLTNQPVIFKRRKFELTRMIREFTDKPYKSLNNFYQRIGLKIAKQQLIKLKQQQLIDELKLLTIDYKLPNIPILIINSINDPIVPLVVTQDNFTNYNNVKLKLWESTSHVLAHCQSQQIFQEINNFLIELNER